MYLSHKKLAINIASLVLFIMLMTPSASAATFKDVSSTHPAQQAISNLSERQIIGGFSDGTFRPNQSVTRGQAAKFIAVSLNLPSVTPAKSHFKDVAADHPFTGYIHALSAKGIIGGYNDGTFKPNQTISRAQLSKILVTAFQAKPKSTIGIPYTDVSKTIWYAPFVQTLYSHGVHLTEQPKSLSPNQLVTRWEMAKWIYDTEVAIKGKVLSDADKLKPIAKQLSEVKLAAVTSNYIPYPKITLPEGMSISWHLLADRYYETTTTANGVYLGADFPSNIEKVVRLQGVIRSNNTSDSISLPVTVTKPATANWMYSSARLDGAEKRIIFLFKGSSIPESIDISKVSYVTNEGATLTFESYTESDTQFGGTYEVGTNEASTPYQTQIDIYLTDADFAKLKSLKGFGNPDALEMKQDAIVTKAGFIDNSFESGTRVWYNKAVTITMDPNPAQLPKGLVGYDDRQGRVTTGILQYTKSGQQISIAEHVDSIILLNTNPFAYFGDTELRKTTDREYKIRFAQGVPDTIHLSNDGWLPVTSLK